MRTACFALLLVCCVGARAEIKHFRRIDDHVYCGHQPHKTDYELLAQKGIKTVLDLRGGMIHRPHEKKEVEAAGMQYASVRLSGIWEPKRRQMAEILALLDDPSRAPIYVHCRRGDDRVGTVIACYRIAHDHWANAQALHEARQNGLNVLELLMQNYIRHFDPSKLPSPAAITADR